MANAPFMHNIELGISSDLLPWCHRFLHIDCNYEDMYPHNGRNAKCTRDLLREIGAIVVKIESTHAQRSQLRE